MGVVAEIVPCFARRPITTASSGSGCVRPYQGRHSIDPRCPIRAVEGFVNIAGCEGPCGMGSALAVLFRARQQILDGSRTGGCHTISAAENHDPFERSASAAASAARVRASHWSPPAIRPIIHAGQEMSAHCARRTLARSSTRSYTRTPMRSQPPAVKLTSFTRLLRRNGRGGRCAAPSLVAASACVARSSGRISPGEMLGFRDGCDPFH